MQEIQRLNFFSVPFSLSISKNWPSQQDCYFMRLPSKVILTFLILVTFSPSPPFFIPFNLSALVAAAAIGIWYKVLCHTLAFGITYFLII